MNEAQCEMLKKFGSDCICVDETHGTNNYDFKLTTMLVLDEMRQGFPACAFLVSNRTDASALAILSEKIREKCGTIFPQIFLSDVAENFYNAWISVMNAAAMRLFCSWYVDRPWRKNLRKIRFQVKQVENSIKRKRC